MKMVHDRLTKRYGWYSSWHEFTHHGKVHFLMFLLIALGVTSALVARVQYDYAYKNQVYAESSATLPPQATLRQTLQDLNTKFLQAVKAFRQTSAGTPDRDAALNNLISLAQQRRQALADAINKNPAEALIQGLPQSVLANMPAEVATLVEQRTAEAGNMQILHVDGVNGTDATLFFLNTTHGKLSLHFSEDPSGDSLPINFMTGDSVKASGVEVGDSLALSVKDLQNNTVSASALSGTFGKVNTLVMLVNFQDNTAQSVTPSDMTGRVFASSTSVSNFDLENSFGQTSLTGSVTNWMTLPMSYSGCNYTTIESDANQAATAAGYVLSNYQRFVYAFPYNSTCTSTALNGGVWAGLGEIGGQHSWINGEFDLRVIGHEMGHNFGLYHSHSLSCGSTVYAASGCTLSEYGDGQDTMGSASGGHFNAYQKERLGWLNFNAQPPIQTVTTSGTYTIAPFSSQDTGVKALKILQSSASSQYYYIEYRQNVGFDSIDTAGVYFHIASPSNANSSDLLRMNPSAGYYYMPVGQSYYDSSSGVTFTLASATATGATVNVSFGQVACVPANPTVSISPSSQASAAGQSVYYNVTVINNDNVGCSSSTFNLTGTNLPAGFIGTFSNAAPSLAPGGSLTIPYQILSPSTALDSSNTFTVTATNAGNTVYAGSASATYVISNPVKDTTPPAVSITNPVNGSTVSGNSATIAATASDNVGVTQVQFYIDGVLKFTDTSAPYQNKWQLRKVSAGIHTITAQAYDAAGNMGVNSVTVTK